MEIIVKCVKNHGVIMLLFWTFLLVFDNKRELGFAKFAIRFVFGIMKMQKEPSANSTLM